jgi:phage terminase large subunit GpA-like protein
MLPNGMPTCGYTLEYFEELVSEQRILTYNKLGFVEFEWTKNRTDPNEALDCSVYSRAALEYLKVRLEQIPRDVQMNLPEQDIERVEVGIDRVIYIDKRQAVRKEVRQHGREARGQSISSSTRPRQQSEGSSGTSRYGAGGATSF